MNEKIRWIDGMTVKRYLTQEQVIRIVKDLWKHAYEDAALEGTHTFLSTGINEKNKFLHIPASLPLNGVLGFKWISCYMEPLQGFPFTHGNLIVLNDIATGSPLAILNADDITSMRTAGGHGVVAASYLAGKCVKTLSVIGSGSQAVRGIDGFLCEFSELETINVYCRRKDAFDKLEEMYGSRVAMKYRSNCSEIGEGADVILVATSSPDILLEYEFIEKGTTIIALDGFIDIAPDIAWRADKWFVGNRDTDIAEIIDSHLMSHGVDLKPSQIAGTMPEVINHRTAGRESDEEIIVYTHMGAGAYDIACAEYVYRKALEAHDGIELNL